MKYLVALLLTSALMLSSIGCGGGTEKAKIPDNPVQGEGDPSSTVTPPPIPPPPTK